MYIHLTTHSAFSLQEGLAQPAELVQAAQAEGMIALGLTDHRLLTGSIEFVLACQRDGIQPILGLEIDLDHGRLALLATSLEGWSNLCRLSTALALRLEPVACCPLSLLSSYSKDLIALSGDLEDPTGSRLRELKEIFPGCLYLTLHDPAIGLQRSDLARRLNIPLVVTHPVYYLNPDQANLQRTLTATRLNQPLDQVSADQAAPNGAFFVSAKDMTARFRGFRTALAATEEIALRSKFTLPLGEAHMPTVPLPADMTATQVLRQKAEAGARRLYGGINPQVRIRLDHELEVIARMGFEPIFLIVEEMLDFARRSGIPFSSRGSAASSLVAHCLGITSPDPLRLDLFFERFLNPARTTPPDIDTDLCSRRRDEVIQHVFDTYGADRVAMVGTINRFRPRSALGEVAKARRVDPGTIQEMIARLPHSFFSRRLEEGESFEPPSPFAELRNQYKVPTYQHIFNEAEAILKLPRHLSVHAGGLIVAPGSLTDLVPVMRSGSKGIIITQLDLEAVEALGLVKIDLLGIRGLTVLGDVAEFICSGQSGNYATPLEVLESTPADDPETSARVEAGETIGCFQIESPGMRATLRAIRARSEDDLIAALALYRPGPLSGGMKDAFVRRFKGEEQVSHLHPTLEPLLHETFGVILYQEQVLRIAHELAGFSLAEADLLRRAMSHFDPGKQMQALKRKFLAEAEAKSQVPAEIGERVWEMMAAFAGYGFPKAHAASYAMVAWRSVWCKTHFPGEFMAAVLANWGGYYSQRVYLSEARRLGLVVRAPHVNFSGRNFVVREDAHSQLPNKERLLFTSLDQIKNLTQHTIDKTIHSQPFSNLEDFLARVNPRPQEAMNLAQVGALEGFGSIPSILQRIAAGSWKAGQPSLFAWSEVGGEDWSLEEKVAAQQELLGISLDAHPLELLADKVTASGAITTMDAIDRIGQRVRVAGIRQSSRRSMTAKSEMMMFLTLEDLTGSLDTILFPNVYPRAREVLGSGAPFIVTGVMEMDASNNTPFLRAEKVARIE